MGAALALILLPTLFAPSLHCPLLRDFDDFQLAQKIRADSTSLEREVTESVQEVDCQ